MTNLKLFEDSSFGGIRTAFSQSNEPLICLADICKAIDIKNVTDTRKRLDNDELDFIEVVNSAGKREEMIFVTEAGMYNVILRSNSPKAKPFRKWVTHTVLPTLRKDGMYVMGEEHIESDEELYARVLLMAERKIQKSHNETIELKSKLVQAQPAIDFHSDVTASKTDVSINEFAKLISKKEHITLGSKELLTYLRELNFLSSKETSWNVPYQKWIKRGIFKYAETPYIDNNGIKRLNTAVYITAEGQTLLHNEIMKYINPIKSVELF